MTTTTIRNLHNDRRAFATQRDAWHADVTKGESIRIFGTDGNRATPTEISRTYCVGDRAVYGSFNLFYVGVILSITEKTVTIDASGTGRKTKRLPLAVFFMRNRRSMESVDAHNEDESQCI